MVVVGGSLAGLRAVETLRNEGFDGPRHADRGRDPPALRPAAAVEEGAGRRVGARAHRAAQATASTATSTSTLRLGRTATGLDVDERVVTVDDGDARALRRPGHRHRGDGRAGCPASPTSTASSCCARSTTPSRCGPRSTTGSPRVVVVGAGFIGVGGGGDRARPRAARSRSSRRCPCRLARGLGPAHGPGLADLHRDHGVDVRLGVGVAAIEGTGRVERVRLTRRLGRARPTSSSSASASRRPPTGWRAAASSCATASCATPPWPPVRPASTPPATSAAGPTRCSARRCGSSTGPTRPSRAPHAARNLLAAAAGGPAAPYAPVPFFWSDQYDARIQFLGRAGRDDEVRVVTGPSRTGGFVALYGRAGRLRGVLGLSLPQARHALPEAPRRRRDLGRRPGPRRRHACPEPRRVAPPAFMSALATAECRICGRERRRAQACRRVVRRHHRS